MATLTASAACTLYCGDPIDQYTRTFHRAGGLSDELELYTYCLHTPAGGWPD